MEEVFLSIALAAEEERASAKVGATPMAARVVPEVVGVVPTHGRSADSAADSAKVGVTGGGATVEAFDIAQDV